MTRWTRRGGDTVFVNTQTGERIWLYEEVTHRGKKQARWVGESVSRDVEFDLDDPRWVGPIQKRWPQAIAWADANGYIDVSLLNFKPTEADRKRREFNRGKRR